MHSALGELTNPSNQALAYPIYGMCWPLGVIIGWVVIIYKVGYMLKYNITGPCLAELCLILRKKFLAYSTMHCLWCSLTFFLVQLLQGCPLLLFSSGLNV